MLLPSKFLAKKSLIAAATSVVILTACNGSSNDDNEVMPVEFTVEDVKANYVAMAFATYNDSLNTAQALHSAIETFIAAPTSATLEAAKAAYKQARIPYQQSEIMRWDTAITIDQALDSDGGPASVDEWEGQVNAWPLDESHIDSIIAGSDPITVALLMAQNGANENEANVTTGVHAIEYMLWGADNNGTGAGAGERPANEFDATNCPDNLCQRRVDYLLASADLLVDDLTLMQTEWSVDASTTTGTLAANFLGSDLALDYIIGSIHAMATDELAGARMNSGLLLGDPEEEHDCFSDLSHIAIYYNFQGIKNAFYGSYGDIDGAGIGDLVKQMDEQTYADLDSALKSIEVHMAQLMEFGERSENPVKFDQIIGQASTGVERVVAETAVSELILLDAKIKAVVELLSLNPIDTSGGGDSD